MLEFDWQVMLSQVLTFLVALFIVWKFGWKPLLQFMADRQKKISSELQNAEQTRQAITQLEEEYKQRLTQIEQKSGELLSVAKIEGEKIREQIVKKAQDEVAEMHSKAKEQLTYERDQLMRALRAEIVGISMSVAQKVLQDHAFSSLQKTKFEGMLTKLESGKELNRAK